MENFARGMRTEVVSGFKVAQDIINNYYFGKSKMSRLCRMPLPRYYAYFETAYSYAEAKNAPRLRACDELEYGQLEPLPFTHSPNLHSRLQFPATFFLLQDTIILLPAIQTPSSGLARNR